MFRVGNKKRLGWAILMVLIGGCVYWLYPIHFGLTGPISPDVIEEKLLPAIPIERIPLELVFFWEMPDELADLPAFEGKTWIEIDDGQLDAYLEKKRGEDAFFIKNVALDLSKVTRSFANLMTRRKLMDSLRVCRHETLAWFPTTNRFRILSKHPFPGISVEFNVHKGPSGRWLTTSANLYQYDPSAVTFGQDSPPGIKQFIQRDFSQQIDGKWDLSRKGVLARGLRTRLIQNMGC